MVLNSTAIVGEQNSSRAKLIVDTSAFSEHDLSQFISISEEIEQTERLRQLQRPVRPSSLKAHMTREEIFECSTLDDDGFLTALEFQNSYVPKLVTNLDESIENLMKYFDEEVHVECKSPTFSGEGKVAAVIASLKSKATTKQVSKVSVASELRTNITELKKKYEMPVQNGRRSPKNSRSPKVQRKSKVKQMAHMFNNKIAEFVRRGSSETTHYTLLTNETSPEGKTKPQVELSANLLTPTDTSQDEQPPVPKPRNKVHKLRISPRASPRPSRRPPPSKPKSTGDSCVFAENVFSQLSVKDKALLYNKFIEDMSKKNPRFHKHVQLGNTKKEIAFGEVVMEKQESVKQLAKELEAKFTLPKQHINMAPLTRNRGTTLPTPKRHPSSPSIQSLPSKSKEAEDIGVVVDSTDPRHISTLTVILKPSPEAARTLPRVTRVPRPALRHKRNGRFHSCAGLIEPTHKRPCNALRSSVTIDAYAPPKKIRRTRAERMAPRKFFQNQNLERLFFLWLKDRNGVAFDIASVADNEETIRIGAFDRDNSGNSLDEEKQKSAVDRLLEEAIAKLEGVDIDVEKQNKDTHDGPVKDIDLTVKIMTSTFQDTNMSTDKTIKSERGEDANQNRGRGCPNQVEQAQPKKKREAPQPPIPPPKPPREEYSSTPHLAISVTNANSSTAPSTKHSEAEESESGLSSLPKPPENELQKSHDHNPAALSEHQLRVQASLQRLNIPDWYRQYNQTNARSPDAGGTTVSSGTGGFSTYKPGHFTRKRGGESGRWAGLNSKTTSLSSLGSQRSDRSPLLLSPSAHSHHGGQSVLQHTHHHQAVHHTGVPGAYGGGGTGFSRWSTSHLNSTHTSPSISQRGSFTRGGPINSSFMSVASGNSGTVIGGGVIRNSFRQPYLGWRSTERLSQRTPHERLASSLIAQQQQRTSATHQNSANSDPSRLQAVSPEIQSSIKEVTSAIVHYVNDQQQHQQNSRSTSPNSRKCWLESSFVGVRPLDSPQTPVIDGASTFVVPSASNLNSNTSSKCNSLNYYNPGNLLPAQQSTIAGSACGLSSSNTTTADVLLRMNGLSLSGSAPERSLSSASLEDVLASLLGLPTSSAGAGASSDAYEYNRSTTGDIASEKKNRQQSMPQAPQPQEAQQPESLNHQQQFLLSIQAEQQRLRRSSEGDATKQDKHKSTNSNNSSLSHTQEHQRPTSHNAKGNANAVASGGADVIPTESAIGIFTVGRRVSLGDSSESNNKTTSELQIKCRNTKCDRSATPTDAKKFYKSCHNCSHLYCSRECRRAHWEKHRKACLHSRASNLCRQVLATCKDDLDAQRHLSLLARKGFLSQGRGVVRVLFRSAEAAEGFIKNGFQCMGEASYVRWPDLMPAEMGLELYSELLKLSTEYKPDSKMLIYVAICVVSEAPGMGQAPVRWERQLVSRCAKLKLCKNILTELDQQQYALHQQPMAVVAVPEPTTEILILTFNPNLTTHREVIISNILNILSRRGVILRKHYPEIFQRLQSYTECQTDKFNPVTLHPRDTQTGESFVCIIMPVHSESEIVKLPSAADGGNRVTTIDVGSPAALAQFDDDELLTTAKASS